MIRLYLWTLDNWKYFSYPYIFDNYYTILYFTSFLVIYFMYIK
nr:MAG TPA: hypothetical protein [Caudoviricetes sp.]DAX34423.1 MAG TPA: hypothetical protein [Caudoviricetes sp.]DAX55239.1 MAG TPA: hypothetical protein [Caudoviricetes sp.]